MRSIIVLLVLTVEAIEELTEPRPDVEESLRGLCAFLLGHGVNTYASIEDAAAVESAIGRCVKDPDINLGPATANALLDVMSLKGRRVISDAPPPPPLELTDLADKRSLWLNNWIDSADVVLLDNQTYELFGEEAGARSPGNVHLTVERPGRFPLTLARINHWQWAPPIEQAASRQVPKLEVDESRDTAGARLFEPLARFGRDFSLIDSYLGKAVVADAFANSSDFGTAGSLDDPLWQKTLEVVASGSRGPADESAAALRSRWAKTWEENTKDGSDTLTWFLNWIARRRDGEWNLAIYTRGNNKEWPSYPIALVQLAVENVLERAFAAHPGHGRLPKTVRLIDLGLHRNSRMVDKETGVRVETDAKAHARWLHIAGQGGEAGICIDHGFDTFQRDPLIRRSAVFFTPRQSSHYAELSRQIDLIDRAQAKWAANPGARQPRRTPTWDYRRDGYVRRESHAPGADPDEF